MGTVIVLLALVWGIALIAYALIEYWAMEAFEAWVLIILGVLLICLSTTAWLSDRLV